MKYDAVKSTVIGLFFDGHARRREHSLDSSTEISQSFESLIVDDACIQKHFQPAFGLDAFFARDLEFGEHIGKALRVLSLGDIRKNARRRFAKLKNGVSVAFD